MTGRHDRSHRITSHTQGRIQQHPTHRRHNITRPTHRRPNLSRLIHVLFTRRINLTYHARHARNKHHPRLKCTQHPTRLRRLNSPLRVQRSPTTRLNVRNQIHTPKRTLKLRTHLRASRLTRIVNARTIKQMTRQVSRLRRDLPRVKVTYSKRHARRHLHLP